MLTAETRVPTQRAARHLAQLCKHAGRMGQSLHRRQAVPVPGGGGHMPPEVHRVECSDTRGTIEFEGGRCVLEASPDALTVRLEAADQAGLRRLQELVARRLETIGSREGLQVSWPGAGPPSPRPERGPGRHRWVLGLGVAGLLALAAPGAVVHLSLLAAVVALIRRTGWGVGLVAAVVVGAVLVVLAKVVVLRHLVRRRSGEARG